MPWKNGNIARSLWAFVSRFVNAYVVDTRSAPRAPIPSSDPIWFDTIVRKEFLIVRNFRSCTRLSSRITIYIFRVNPKFENRDEKKLFELIRINTRRESIAKDDRYVTFLHRIVQNNFFYVLYMSALIIVFNKRRYTVISTAIRYS